MSPFGSRRVSHPRGTADSYAPQIRVVKGDASCRRCSPCHGFGFSSALRELHLPTEGLVISLFGFNAGVEIGQAAVVLVAVPAFALLRRMIWGTSAAILVLGVALFVERALL